MSGSNAADTMYTSRCGPLEHTAHCFDAELRLLFFNKDILHFRRFAKYVAAFWRMASSSSRSASWRLRRAIPVDISSSHSEECLLMLLFTAPVVEL